MPRRSSTSTLTHRRRVNPVVKAAVAKARLERRAEKIGAKLEPVVRKRAKFNQVKATYNGQKYDSLGEAEYAQKLDLKKAAFQIKNWSRPSAIVLLDAPTLRGRITYKPDFKVELFDGTVLFYDYKGSHATMTQAWRLKVKMWNMTQPYPLYVAFPSGEEQLVARGI